MRTLPSSRIPHLIRLLLALIMLIVSVALPTRPSAAQGDPVTVSWSVWGSEQELASHQRVADTFMKRNPSIRIEIRHVPWENYHRQVQEWVASGDPAIIPDIMWLGEDFDRYYAAGVLENLSPWIERTKYDTSAYWPGLLERASYPEGIFGLQRDLDLRLLYYNKAIFDEANVSYPDETWTWADWAAAAAKLTVISADGSVARFGLGMELGKFDMLLSQNDGRLLDDIRNPSRCMLTTPEALAVVEFLTGLLNNRYAMRPADLEAAGGDAQAFLTGKAAMIIQNGSRAPTFNEANMNYDVAPIPIPEDGKRVNNNDGARFVMSSRSAHKAEAWAFLSWLQSAEGGQRLYTETGEIFPALHTVAESDVFMKIAQKPANRAAFSLEASGGRYLVLGDFPDWGDLNDNIVQPALARLWAGEGDPQEIAISLCAAIDDFLAANGYPKP